MPVWWNNPGHVLERRRDRCLQAHVDVLPATRALAGEECGENAGGGEDTGLMVRLETERVQRRAVGVAADREHPAHRLGDQVGACARLDTDPS